MTDRSESPVPPAARLTTGCFRMRRRYARWRANGAPGWLLIYTLGGRARFGHERGNLVATRGDLVLIRPKVRHDYGLDPKLGRWDLLWAYFFPRAEWHPFLAWPEVGPGLFRLHLGDRLLRRRIVHQLAEADRLNNGPLHHAEVFAMNALEKGLLLCDSANPHSEQAAMDSRVAHALQHLCEHLSEPVTLPALASECRLSTSRLAHLFREQVGQTPQQFFELKRIERACRLLEFTQSSVGAIAAAVGYNDLFYFSHRFKRRTGLSPRAFRHRLAHSQPIPWLRPTTT